MRHRRAISRAFTIAVLVLVCTGALHAAPFTPTRDQEVLERLALPPGDPVAREIRQWHAALRRTPENLPVALRLAERYIGLGRQEGDPRYDGYAEAVLRPWWAMTPPPPQVLVLRALLRQRRHDFAGALRDLDEILAAEPRNAQAHLTRAIILQVQGAHAEALRHCAVLLRLGRTLLLPATTCLSRSLSRSGQAEQGFHALKRALASTSTAAVQDRLWALTVLAEITAGLGQYDAAETYFQEAFALGQRDTSLLAAYADFLLDQDRAVKVRNLLREETRADGLLLRLTLAEQRLDSPHLATHIASLRARFHASRKRGNAVHQRDEARFVLHILHQPRAALRLAQANWETRREPPDARILLEAALAAHDRSAAQPVLAWLTKTGLQDGHLARLAAALGRVRS